jgi:hypothetical protein
MLVTACQRIIKSCLAECIGVSLFLASSKGEETHASDIDGVSFRLRSKSRLLSKCRRCSGRRRSYEAGCNRHFNSARGAILRASHPARHHQVLPGIRRGAAGLPPLPSLVVVVKPGPGLHPAGEVRSTSAAACRSIDLHTLDRRRDAALNSLIPALSCRSCRPNAPFDRLMRLSRTSIADEKREEHRRRLLPRLTHGILGM